MNAIHWVIPDLIFKGREKSAEILLNAALASIRMRTFPAIKAMEEKGFHVSLGEQIVGQGRHEVIGVHEIGVRPVLDAFQQGVRPRDLELVPAHVRNL